MENGDLRSCTSLFVLFRLFVFQCIWFFNLCSLEVGQVHRAAGCSLMMYYMSCTQNAMRSALQPCLAYWRSLGVCLQLNPTQWNTILDFNTTYRSHLISFVLKLRSDQKPRKVWRGHAQWICWSSLCMATWSCSRLLWSVAWREGNKSRELFLSKLIALGTRPSLES